MTGLAAIAVVATATARLGRRQPRKPTIVLANNSWEGSTANNVVAQYVIEKNLGYNVNLADDRRDPRLAGHGPGQGLGRAWRSGVTRPLYAQVRHGQPSGDRRRASKGPTATSAGTSPTYLMQQHPELKTWKGVQKDWKLFVTPQSSPQGQFLDGSASYVTNDQALVTNLKINLKVVFAGTEAAQLTEIESDYKAKKPVLFYWYTPQYQNAHLQVLAGGAAAVDARPAPS